MPKEKTTEETTETKNSRSMPFMQWYVGDWLNDSRVTVLSPATRGIWVDLLSHMHQLDRQGLVSGTSEQLARYARCSVHELLHALHELSTSGAADIQSRQVSTSHVGVTTKHTVINRRMRRDFLKRTKACKRKQNQRDREKGPENQDNESQETSDRSHDLSHADVTPMSRDIVQSSEFRDINHKPNAQARDGEGECPDVEPTVDPPCTLQQAKDYGNRIGLPDDVTELWWERGKAYNWRTREGFPPITKQSWQFELKNYQKNRTHKDHERKHRIANAGTAKAAKAGSVSQNPRNAHVSDAERDLRKHRARVQEVYQHLEMLADDPRADTWPGVPDWRNSEYREEAIAYLDERFPAVLQQLAEQGFLRHEPETGWTVTDDKGDREMEREMVSPET